MASSNTIFSSCARFALSDRFGPNLPLDAARRALPLQADCVKRRKGQDVRPQRNVCLYCLIILRIEAAQPGCCRAAATGPVQPLARRSKQYWPVDLLYRGSLFRYSAVSSSRMNLSNSAWFSRRSKRRARRSSSRRSYSVIVDSDRSWPDCRLVSSIASTIELASSA